ncbi:MAG: hypothetical protein ABUK01_15555 [Leptospirales bacterium]
MGVKVSELYQVRHNTFYVFIFLFVFNFIFTAFMTWGYIASSVELDDYSAVVFMFINVNLFIMYMFRKYPESIILENEEFLIHFYFRKDIRIAKHTLTKMMAVGKGFRFGDIKLCFSHGVSINLLESSDTFIPFFMGISKQTKQCEMVNFNRFHKQTFLHPDDIALIMKEVSRITTP